jgi:acetyl esterase/lipase
VGKSAFFGPNLASRTSSLKSLLAFAARRTTKTGVWGRAGAVGTQFRPLNCGTKHLTILIRNLDLVLGLDGWPSKKRPYQAHCLHFFHLLWAADFTGHARVYFMRTIAVFALGLGLIMSQLNPARAQTDSVYLWPVGQEPFDRPGEPPETVTAAPGRLLVRNVSRPQLKVFLPTKGQATGRAVIICPGGGYYLLASLHEGDDFARWLAAQGIAAFVLKYRLPNPELVEAAHKPWVPLADAQQALRLVRTKAGAWGVDPGKVGIMGFSAGGHLAATAATQFARPLALTPDSLANVRPDFAILVYPVVSFRDSHGHAGSRANLIGPELSTQQIDFFSAELRVTPQTPPTFLVHSADDQAVPVENSLRFYQALVKNKVPAELHLYPTGGHGYGFGRELKGGVATWTEHLRTWLSGLDGK